MGYKLIARHHYCSLSKQARDSTPLEWQLTNFIRRRFGGGGSFSGVHALRSLTGGGGGPQSTQRRRSPKPSYRRVADLLGKEFHKSISQIMAKTRDGDEAV